MSKFSPKTFIMLLLTAGIAIAALAQDKPKKRESHKAINLTILPKSISHDSLIDLMKEYSVSLGVSCGFCHVKSATDEKRLDFASDDNRKKKVARYMMTMTSSINSNYFAEENHGGEKLTVSCFTCHNGHKEPEVFVMPKEEERH